jgi:hypothetical protein
MILFFCYTAFINFKCYTLLYGNNAIKQKTFHSSIACYVHVRLLIYNAAKHVFMSAVAAFVSQQR